MDIFEQAKQIVRDQAATPASAYRRAVDALESGRELTMPDRDIVAAAVFAIRQDRPITAVALLDELDLRMAATEPIDIAARRAA